MSVAGAGCELCCQATILACAALNALPRPAREVVVPALTAIFIAIFVVGILGATSVVPIPFDAAMFGCLLPGAFFSLLMIYPILLLYSGQ